MLSSQASESEALGSSNSSEPKMRRGRSKGTAVLEDITNHTVSTTGVTTIDVEKVSARAKVCLLSAVFFDLPNFKMTLLKSLYWYKKLINNF